MITKAVKINDVNVKLYRIDATGKILGKVAVKASQILLGKFNPAFVRYIIKGDKVIIENISKLKISSKKLEKKYYSHSMYPGGLKVRTLKQIYGKDPSKLIQLAVKGMLPKNRLGRRLITNMSLFNKEAPSEVIKKSILINNI